MQTGSRQDDVIMRGPLRWYDVIAKRHTKHGFEKMYCLQQITVYRVSQKNGTCINQLCMHLRGSNSKKKFFVCFNAMQFIFGQVLGHGTTNIKISFSKLPLPWLPC